MEKCCLIVSANVSYQNAAIDIKVLTGIEVSAKTQQRLVHRHKFKLPKLNKTIEELSVDGVKIWLRTPLGEPCIWRDVHWNQNPRASNRSIFSGQSNLN